MVSNIRLAYPVYAASFDPYNNDFLFVGGGGGEGRSGIPNQITLLDTSAHDSIKSPREITLSRDEDSVQSLAVAHSDSNAATLYAGINSSQADQDAGKNEHLRAFRVSYPSRKGAELQSHGLDPPKPLSRASIFTAKAGPKQETYQKVLRLSPARADISTRLGAVATRDAASGEIILFDASKQAPGVKDILHRIQLGNGEEAGDIDIIEGQDDGFLVTYCTDTNIHVFVIDPNGDHRNVRVFAGSKRDGSFRSLRFLDRNHILMVRNFPRKTGAQMLMLKIPSKVAQGIQVYGKAFHKGFNAALALDIARLPALHGAAMRQYIAAVAGQDGSLVLFTIDQNPKLERQMKVKQHSIFKDLHPAGITSLAFSHFKTPHSGTATTPLRLKLASTSFANTVVVHTFPLKSHPNPRQSTYQTLATPPQRTAGDSLLSLTTGALLIAFIAIIAQVISELQGSARHELLYARSWAPEEVKYFWGGSSDVGMIQTNAPLSQAISMPRQATEATPTMESLPPTAPVAENAEDAIAEAVLRIKAAADQVPSPEEAKSAKMPAVLPSLEEITQHIVTDLPVGVQGGAQKIVKLPTDAEKESKRAFKKIRNILNAHHRKDDQKANAPGAIMLADSKKGEGLTLSTHEHEDQLASSGAKKWEELSKVEQHMWKKRLSEAGHWAEGETEKILKGVFFGTLAGLVGNAVG